MSLRHAAPVLAAAVLFGASTPLAKLLLGDTPALLLAGLLYLGSGLGLGALLLARRGLGLLNRTREDRNASFSIPRQDLPWLAGAIAAGGIVGPALLMAGLARSSAASASLLLNLEGVLTALIAWLVFKENADRRIVLGMAAIVAGGALLAWEPHGASLSPDSLLIAGACLCWAIDNNLTRKVSANDAMLLACLKGLVAGACNTGLALLGGSALPPPWALAGSLLLGFAGYGVSLALFVLALRTLGTARAGAYFSAAPLFGVMLALLIWPAEPGLAFWAAAALTAFGVWLHVRERHAHRHRHFPLDHAHRHRHDAHHQHEHAVDCSQGEPHVHPHSHPAVTHEHEHYPDVHHRHDH